MVVREAELFAQTQVRFHCRHRGKRIKRVPYGLMSFLGGWSHSLKISLLWFYSRD